MRPLHDKGADADATERAQREADPRLCGILETFQRIALGLDANGSVIFCNQDLLHSASWQVEELRGPHWSDTCLHLLADAGQEFPKCLGECPYNYGQMAQLQAVLYHIAHVARQNVDMECLYRFIHQELSGILNVQNFYIALYDADQDLLLFPYYVDETRVNPSHTSGHCRKPRKGLTEYVLRTGQALFAYEEDIRALAEKGEIELIGALSRVWMGAPLRSGEKIIGVIAVQSYTDPAAYTRKDLALLEFTASQIGSAIERKWTEESLRETNRRLEHTLAELQRTQQQVIQQERLRALGTMASGIAHDFNNALAPILGYSELLLMRPDDLNDRERVRHYLKQINTAAQDAAHIVSRLREFYRHRDESEMFLPVHLHQIVEQAILLTQPRWRNQAQASDIPIHVQTDLRPVPPVMGNESDLREIITNLIFNAVDAMPSGGVITIRTYQWSGIEHPRTSTHVVLEVSDTGIGMTEEVRRRCLEPFFTTKGERGTGMGLAMVYGIVQRHGGTMEIESALGRGTTITIRLPIQHECPVEREKGTTERPLHPLNVLVIEDEPLVCDTLTEYLIRDGHTFEVASNGLEGLQRFEIGKFDLVITDRAMPGMNGDHVAMAIKQMEPRVPVIMLTGFGDLMNSVGERPFGVDLVVSKPVTMTEMRQAIAQVTAREKLDKT